MLAALLCAVAVLCVGLAVAGGIANHSPVPYWDMWDGYIDFFTRLSHGEESAWWAQHNEHRIVLAKALFWVNHSFFDGSLVFLHAANYFLAGLIVLVFVLIARTLLQGASQALLVGLAGLIATLTFSWFQYNNFAEPFQNMFFTAQLFPLVAFWLLALSQTSKSHADALFLMAALAGVASAGTLANGVLTLPLMAIMAVVLRAGRVRVGCLTLLGAIVIAAYFASYEHVEIHRSPTETLFSDPLGLVQFVLVYVAYPLFAITLGIGGFLHAQIAGVVFLVATAFFAYRAVTRQPYPDPIQLALIAFITYVIGTAAVTGAGRLSDGSEFGMPSRYLTPSLAACSALLLLATVEFGTRVQPHRALTGLILIAMSFIPYQFVALEPDRDNSDLMIAALAQELGVNDPEELGAIYPLHLSGEVLALGREAVARNWSIFGHPLIKDVAQQIGTTSIAPPTASCIGAVQGVSPLEKDASYLKVRGWLYEPDRGRTPESIWLTDAEGTIVGYALTGLILEDATVAPAGVDKHAGFRGYLLPEYGEQPLTLIGSGPDCVLRPGTPDS